MKAKENMQWNAKCNIFKILKKFSIGVPPIKILTIHFCNLKILELEKEVPPKIKPYDMTK